ncbi:unnamed protein product [Pleuronectes platessa]|uniref:Uncharacterized protein n=1 Tax=Pleuronectes platessa TaxID=8262 RepID=A0A9N7TZP5_PLEPL|nr:unnamed protein product [Pleuronectes platessa]
MEQRHFQPPVMCSSFPSCPFTPPPPPVPPPPPLPCPRLLLQPVVSHGGGGVSWLSVHLSPPDSRRLCLEFSASSQQRKVQAPPRIQIQTQVKLPQRRGQAAGHRQKQVEMWNPQRRGTRPDLETPPRLSNMELPRLQLEFLLLHLLKVPLQLEAEEEQRRTEAHS